MHCALGAITANMNEHETFSGVISFDDEQSLSYENHCECYKKLTPGLCPVLFIYIYIYIYLPNFFLYIHSHLLKKNKNLL